MDSHPGKPDTKAQKTPKSDRDAGDKAAALEKKKPTKNDKQLRDVDEEVSYRDECCADCNKEVLDSHSAVTCDGCGLWHHTACEQVSDEVYAFLCAHRDPSLHWMCKKCTVSFQQLFSSVRRIDDAQRRLEQKFDAMISKLEAANKAPDDRQEEAQKRFEDRFDVMINKLEAANKAPDGRQEEAQKRFEDRLTQQLTHIEVKLDSKVPSREEKEEEDDKDRRKCNVIIYGLKEPTATETEDRRQEDCVLAEELLHKLSCDDVSVSHIARLGAPPTGSDSKIRPVKLELASADARNKVLRNSKNLRRETHPSWKSVFLHPDLTPREREARKHLVQELKDRKAAGEVNLIIVNNKIVARRTHTY